MAAIIKWYIARIGGGAGDTYDDDAKLLEFDIHYLITSIGSGKEYPKS